MTREELVKRAGHRDALGGGDALLKKYGTITLAQAVQPAIGYAENGFPVTPVIAGDWNQPILSRDEGAKETFLIEGQPPKAGQWFKNPDLAGSLRLVAKEGAATMYGGTLGQKIVARLHDLGGFLT